MAAKNSMKIERAQIRQGRQFPQGDVPSVVVIQEILGPPHRKAFATIRGRRDTILADAPNELDEKVE